MAKKKFSEMAKEVINSVIESKVESKPETAIPVENKVEIREEKKMAKGIKIKQRYYNPVEKRWEPCELTGNISLGEIGNFKIENGIVEVADLATANDIIEKTKEVVLERNPVTLKVEKKERKFWEIVA